MKYILVRHGETLQNVGQGANELDPCAALSPKGLKQTEQAVKKISAILLEKNIRASLYYSPYRRTKHMAELLQREVPFFSVREEPLLSEIQCGSFSGYTMKNYGVEHPDEYKKFVRYRNEKCRFYYRFPDGESPFDVYVRICLFLGQIADDAEGFRVIISHYNTLKILELCLLQKDLDWYEENRGFDNAEIHIISAGEIIATVI